MKPRTFFYGGLLLSSIDSFSLFTSISTYAPYFSVILFALYYFSSSKNLCSFQFNRRQFAVLVIIIFSLAYSFYRGLVVYHDLYGFVTFSVQLLIAVLLYKSFNCYFKQLAAESYCEEFGRCFISATLPVLAIGFFEMLIFPFKSIYVFFVSLFSSRVTLGRVQLLSGEPAWATRLLLTYLSLIPIARYAKKKQLILLLAGLVLLLATGSTLGIVCVGVYYAITYLRGKYISYYVTAALIIALLAPVVYNHLNNYTKARIDLLLQLNSSDVETLAVKAGSGSVMARLGNPILAYHMGNDHMPFGVGGGYYYQYHYEYLGDYFPRALKIKNVYRTGTVAKNLIARIYAETGIIGLLPLLWALCWLYKRKVHNNLLRGIFLAMLLLTVNFDTLFHIYPLLLFCFLLNLPSIPKPVTK